MSIPIGTQTVDYEQAQLITTKELLRTECIPTSTSADEAGATLKRQALSGMVLQFPTLAQISPNVIELRGYKAIGGERAAYVVRIYRGSTSTLTLLLGARSFRVRPTQNSNTFFQTVKGQ